MGYKFFLPMVLRWRASRAKAPLLSSQVQSCIKNSKHSQTEINKKTIQIMFSLGYSAGNERKKYSWNIYRSSF